MPYQSERAAMVTGQLIARGISDKRVLDALKKIPRHEFVDAPSIDEAYADHPLPIGNNQTISQPYMVALMTEYLKLKGGERVLEIGTGSGYQTAVLAELAAEVYSVERFEGLAKKAGLTLDRLGYKNIEIKIGDGTLGWQEKAPFDAILVTAAAPKIPAALTKQLKNDGRLIIPVGSAYGQALTLAVKKPGGITVTEVCGCVFVPLIGKEGWGNGKND